MHFNIVKQTDGTCPERAADRVIKGREAIAPVIRPILMHARNKIKCVLNANRPGRAMVIPDQVPGMKPSAGPP
jgi:hypothetical protein